MCDFNFLTVYVCMCWSVAVHRAQYTFLRINSVDLTPVEDSWTCRCIDISKHTLRLSIHCPGTVKFPDFSRHSSPHQCTSCILCYYYPTRHWCSFKMLVSNKQFSLATFPRLLVNFLTFPGFQTGGHHVYNSFHYRRTHTDRDRCFVSCGFTQHGCKVTVSVSHCCSI